MRFRLIAIGVLTLFGSVGLAQAACSRADVDHFLSRGFSQEQVVLLCGDARSDAVEPDRDAVDSERELRELLMTSVDARRVSVDETELRWQVQECLEYAPPNLAGRPRERCGEVSRSVLRVDLQVESVKKRILFFGEHGLMLAGPVKQSWKMDSEGLNDFDADRLAKAMTDSVEEALLPLHGSADIRRVERALEKWSGRN